MQFIILTLNVNSYYNNQIQKKIKSSLKVSSIRLIRHSKLTTHIKTLLSCYDESLHQMILAATNHTKLALLNWFNFDNAHRAVVHYNVYFYI